MNKTKIEWAEFSWNPIKGICPVGCWYCYGKAIYNRFEWMQEEIGENGYLAEWELEQPIKRKKPTKIFVCSTYELFLPCAKFARDEIFKIIESCPQHTFQILTKMPENIDRKMPDNVWLGVTVDKPIIRRLNELKKKKAKFKFVSFEPMLGRMNNTFMPEDEMQLLFAFLDWIIIGRLTGYGNRFNPKKEWIKEIVNKAKELNIPIFLKDNLKDIWKEPLIQEFPK